MFLEEGQTEKTFRENLKLTCKISSSQSGRARCGVNSSSRDYIVSSAG